MGHAGAIISGGKGTAADKIKSLKDAGIAVADDLTTIGKNRGRSLGLTISVYLLAVDTVSIKYGRCGFLTAPKRLDRHRFGWETEPTKGAHIFRFVISSFWKITGGNSCVSY